MNRRGQLAVLVGALCFLIVPLVADTYRVNLVSQMMIFAMLAMSIDVLSGYTGRTSLCHGAIFGTATYVMIYYTAVLDGSPVVGALLAIAASTVLAAIIAVLAIRTTGAYFLLLTLALGMVVWGVVVRWTSVTGGENGLRGSIRPDWLLSPTSFYYAVFVIFALVTLLLWRFVESPFGLTLKGIRDSSVRMQALGYNVPLHVFIAFTVSGVFAGIAGVAYAYFNGFVSPTTVGLAQSVQGLLMSIVGGAGTLFGGIVGAVIVTEVENIVSAFTDRWSMVLGLLFVITMMTAPEGILGRIKTAFAKSEHKSGQSEPASQQGS